MCVCVCMCTCIYMYMCVYIYYIYDANWHPYMNINIFTNELWFICLGAQQLHTGYLRPKFDYSGL